MARVSLRQWSIARAARQLAYLTPAIALPVVAAGALSPAAGAWVAMVAMFFAPGFLLWLALPRPAVRDAAALPALFFVASFALITPSLFVGLLFNTSVDIVLWSLVAELAALSWFAAQRTGIPIRWPRARGLALIVLIAVAGAATLRFFTRNELGDDVTYVGMIKTIGFTGSYPSANPFIAGDLSLAPRWAMNGWTGAFGTLASLSDIDGSVLLLRYLPPLLIVLGASAAYLLGRFLTRDERFGLAAAAIAVLLPLLAEPKGNPSQFLFWYRAIQQDKYAALLIFFPVVVTFFLATFHRPRLPLMAASAGLLLTLFLVHPLIAAFVPLVVGSYAVVHSVLNLRFPARRFLLLALPALPTLAAGGLLALSQGDFGVNFFEIASLSDVFVRDEVGPFTFWTPHRIRATAVQADDAFRFFVNYHLTLSKFNRLMFLTKDLFIVSPGVLSTPINLFVPAAALLLLLRRQRSALTAFIVGSSLVAVTAMFVPPVGRAMAVAIPPFQLWRFVWLLPAGLAATWLYTVLIRRHDHAWLLPAYALLVLVVMWTPHDKLLTFAKSNQFALRGVAAELQAYDGVLLAPRDLGDVIATHAYGLRPIAFRGAAVMSNSFPSDRREEALQRMQDRVLFFKGSTSLADRLAIIDRYGATYVLVRRGRQTTLGIDALPLRHVTNVKSYALYEVVPEAPTDAQTSESGAAIDGWLGRMP